MLAAMGTEARLRIMRLLLAAHPQGMVPGEMQEKLGLPGSTLSHHLEKLKTAGLVEARRERQFLWYTAKPDTLRELLSFLFAQTASDPELRFCRTFSASSCAASPGETISTARSGAPSMYCSGSMRLNRSARTNATSGALTVGGYWESRKPASMRTRPRPAGSAQRSIAW